MQTKILWASMAAVCLAACGGGGGDDVSSPPPSTSSDLSVTMSGPANPVPAGTTASFSVMDSMVIIGPDMSRARLRHAINALGGFGKNKQKDLDKIYAKLGAAEPSAEVNT